MQKNKIFFPIKNFFVPFLFLCNLFEVISNKELTEHRLDVARMYWNLNMNFGGFTESIKLHDIVIKKKIHLKILSRMRWWWKFQKIKCIIWTYKLIFQKFIRFIVLGCVFPFTMPHFPCTFPELSNFTLFSKKNSLY